MTDRERFIATVLGQPVDRPPYWLYWSPWATTHLRWLREGLPEGLDYLVRRMQRDGVNLLFPMEVAAGCDVNQ